MKLVIIIGGGASGKMTVGQELCKITDLRLFHNHMTIDLVMQVFGYFEPETILRLRRDIFEGFAKSGNYGLVFTYIWDFSSPSDGEYIRGVAKIFEDAGAEIYLVELVADFYERLRRNRTENRLANKPGKRNLEFSEALIYDEKTCRVESLPGETGFENYLRIDNTRLSAEDAAKLIKERFGL